MFMLCMHIGFITAIAMFGCVGILAFLVKNDDNDNFLEKCISVVLFSLTFSTTYWYGVFLGQW